MKYPMIAKWLHFKQMNAEWFLVTNRLNGEEYYMTAFMAHFARRLDGNTPPRHLLSHEKRRDAENLVAELDQWDMLRHSRMLEKGWGTLYWSVFFFDKSSRCKALCKILNNILLLSFLPCFFIGIMMAICWCQPCLNFSLFGMVIGTLLGIIVHEAAHTIAGISYHATVYECGVFIDHFLPGAYAMVDTKNVQNKRYLLQISGAGLESNILLAGLFLAVATFESYSSIFFWMAMGNLILAGANLLPINDLDGMHMLETLLETDSLYERITYITHSRRIKRKIKHAGLSGYCALWVCYFIQILNFIWRMQYLLAIFIALFWNSAI